MPSDVASASCGAVFGKVSRRGGSQGPVVALGGALARWLCGLLP